MPPRNIEPIHFVADDDDIKGSLEPVIIEDTPTQKRPPMVIVWRNVILMAYLHLAALYGLYLLPWSLPQTLLWTLYLYMWSAFGITAGAHRLWTHRSYKAKLPLRIFLAIGNSMAFQNDIIEWSRDHRVHHKYSETEADPHNAKRGFFFAHVGWLLVRKHPEVKEKGRLIDISDITSDPVCIVQRKFYLPSVLLFCFLLPALVPWYFWGESLWLAFFVSSILRYVLVLNMTWCVNSVAHLFGNHPYDRHINPSQNLMVVVGAVGEGFHNYHHVYPHDYATSEFGWKLNATTLFIDLMAWLGQATDRKTVSTEVIKKRRLRTGDGTHGFDLLNQVKSFLRGASQRHE